MQSIITLIAIFLSYLLLNELSHFLFFFSWYKFFLQIYGMVLYFIFFIGILSLAFFPNILIYLWNLSSTNFFASFSDFAVSSFLFQISHSSTTFFIFIVLLPFFFFLFSPSFCFFSSFLCFCYSSFFCFGFYCLLYSFKKFVIFTSSVS